MHLNMPYKECDKIAPFDQTMTKKTETRVVSNTQAPSK
jgi:hypothetical protein